MLPLILFYVVEGQGVIASATRILRLVRLFRLVHLFFRALGIFERSSNRLLYLLIFSVMGLGQLDYNKRKIIIQYSLEAILLSKWYLILLFVQKITYLDLCHTPIDKQFYTCNIAAVIRSKE